MKSWQKVWEGQSPRRKMAAAGIVLLFLLLFCFFPWERQAPAKEETPVSPEAEKKPAAGRMVFAAETGGKEKIKNPFSAAHEERTSGLKKAGASSVQQTTQARRLGGVEPAGKPPASEAVKVIGVLEEKGEKLVLFSRGVKTFSLRPSEVSDGVVLLAVEEKTVRIKTAAGEEVLRLAP